MLQLGKVHKQGGVGAVSKKSCSYKNVPWALGAESAFSIKYIIPLQFLRLLGDFRLRRGYFENMPTNYSFLCNILRDLRDQSPTEAKVEFFQNTAESHHEFERHFLESHANFLSTCSITCSPPVAEHALVVNYLRASWERVDCSWHHH